MLPSRRRYFWYGVTAVFRDEHRNWTSTDCSLQGIVAVAFVPAWNKPVINYASPATAESAGITFEEVQKHRSADDCWVIIDVSGQIHGYPPN